MCNACGFWCCAWDGFSGCGCDHCKDPACWPDDLAGFDDDDDADDHHPSCGCDYCVADNAMAQAAEPPLPNASASEREGK